MTDSSQTSAGNRSGKASAAFARAFTWGLHVLVSLLAVFSLLTNHFYLWIDLRMLGRAAIAIEFLWIASVLLVPFCAGPRLRGFTALRWVNRGFSSSYARLLLIPTYFFITCLLINTIYFFMLLRRDLVEGGVPMPLIAALLLSVWVLSTNRWIGVSRELSITAPAQRRVSVLATVFVFACAIFFGGFFLLHCYSNPPTEPVDLAVVLGYGVRSDGVATPILAARTQAAIDLYKHGLVKHILLSGSIDPPRPPGTARLNETIAMYHVCKKYGVPDSALTLDPLGINTRATAYNTKLFMQSSGYKTVVACSSDWHLLRTAMSFREVGIKAFTVPAPPTEWICADPHDVLREMIGVVVYAVDPDYHRQGQKL